jgi:hypothetical protein
MFRDEEGQGRFVEISLVLLLVILVAVAALRLLGQRITELINRAANALR